MKQSDDLKMHLKLTQDSRKLLFTLLQLKINKGNFEKSIEMYNYALAKDKIPFTSYKTAYQSKGYMHKAKEIDQNEK